ncbi:MAG: hypothetical protein FRX48_07094 [Lasallia pustulata]|uniref:Uncharacterized protein n=1 Tax=Lasallia pustulata TaxID=136370 RepID=A0A5M8PH82_9LECA|nr:MAG: hypothetical protein FRX48_07094 [Lasallia pustulata]
MPTSRDHRSWLVLAVLLSAVLVRAIPIRSLALVPRGQLCTNAPDTIAGTSDRSSFDRRISVCPYIGSRSATDTVRWDARNSHVYLLLTQSGAIRTDEVAAVLASAWDKVNTHLTTIGDGLLPGEFFEQFQAVALRVWNANNHQTTWEVLKVAILALEDFLDVKRGIGAVVFRIFDGNNQVGQGQIYYAIHQDA